LAHALVPHTEWFLRSPSILLGTLAVILIYRLCLLHGLAPAPARWAAAAFALSHWIWHTSSYLHPDGFLVPCWLAVLLIAHRCATSHKARHYALMGAAAGLSVLCKYSGAFLVGGLVLWIVLSHQQRERWQHLTIFLLTVCIVASPLLYTQLQSGFYLPQTLSTLSRIEGIGDPLARLLFFTVNPVLFASPLLLYLLYRGLVYAAKQRELLALLPALCTIGAFLFFALYRGQIKGNWILPGFLSLWPLAFSGSPRRWLLTAVLATGLIQTTTIGIGLKYPALFRAAAERSGLDQSYIGLVSSTDREREPSFAWSERLCEYRGWRIFAAELEKTVHAQAIDPQLPLLSSQYSLPFALAYYGSTNRNYFTVDDPRFRDLTDFHVQSEPHDREIVLFVVRTGSTPPVSLLSIYPQRELIAEIARESDGCAPMHYRVILLER